MKPFGLGLCSASLLSRGFNRSEAQPFKAEENNH